MKKTVLCTAAMLALATVGYIGSRLGAQQTSTAPAAVVSGHGTRLAIMNLAYVIKNYQKFKTFEQEMKENLKQFDDRIAAKRTLFEQYQKEAQTTTTPGRKEELEKSARVLQREVEDINNDAKAFIGRKRDEQIVQLYREVQDAAQRYALSQGIDLVLHYTDAVVQEDYYNPVNVARKMQSPGAMPLYHSAGIDISREVVMSLNSAYRQSAAPAPPGSATTQSR